MRAGRNLSGRIVFTGVYNRLTSMDVRARQIAEPLKALYVRGKYLQPERATYAMCVIWVAVADITKVRAIQAPQIFDVINPSVEKGEPYLDLVEEFDTLILNTRSTLEFLRPRRRGEWRTRVIPHHHCNRSGYLLPEERVARPKTVGYVGQPEHLHDREEIQAAVEKMGLRFLCADTHDLNAYKMIDIGVAWTRPEELRDKTRSNIKLTNFCAHGIPSVVCNYESYRDVDAALGGGACLIRQSPNDFIEGIRDLAGDEGLRRSVHDRASSARELYSLESVAREYRELIDEVEGLKG
jgi:hypothetical protein